LDLFALIVVELTAEAQQLVQRNQLPSS